MILEVGSRVLEQACQACSLLLRQGLIERNDFRMGVNISPRQFHQNDFVERIEHTLQTFQLPGNMLKLEITESMVIQSMDDTITKMLRLKKLGISFAMDDFGTGYSSLTSLKRLPIDTLKIDQSFVRDATTDPNDAEIIRAITAMAQSLNLHVIAEGVETPSNWRFCNSRAAMSIRAICSASHWKTRPSKPCCACRGTCRRTSQGVDCSSQPSNLPTRAQSVSRRNRSNITVASG